MAEVSVVKRIKALGQYAGSAEPVSVIRDVYQVASTLLHPLGGDYCVCQSLPCECVGRFMDDLAECLAARHPGLDVEKTGEERSGS